MRGDLRPAPGSSSSPGLLSLLLKCLCKRRSSSAVGCDGSWWSFSCDEHCEETLELPGVFVPYPDEGSDATDHLRPSIRLLVAENGK